MEEILKELQYHRKLLEDIVMRLDEQRHAGEQARANAQGAINTMLNNPMLNANPKMAEAMRAAMQKVGIGGV